MHHAFTYHTQILTYTYVYTDEAETPIDVTSGWEALAYRRCEKTHAPIPHPVAACKLDAAAACEEAAASASGVVS